MARMYPADLVRLVRKGMGNPTGVEWPDVEILRLLNEAMKQLCTRYRMGELLTYDEVIVPAGDTLTELAVDNIAFFDQDARNVTTGLRVELSSKPNWIRNNQTTTPMRGDVLKWHEEGLGSNGRRQMKTWQQPTRDNTIQFNYQRYCTELQLSPTPVPFEWNDQWDLPCIDFAVAIGLGFDQDRSEAMADKDLASERVDIAAKGLPRSAKKVWSPRSPVAGAVDRRGRR